MNDAHENVDRLDSLPPGNYWVHRDRNRSVWRYTLRRTRGELAIPGWMDLEVATLNPYTVAQYPGLVEELLNTLNNVKETT